MYTHSPTHSPTHNPTYRRLRSTICTRDTVSYDRRAHSLSHMHTLFLLLLLCLDLIGITCCLFKRVCGWYDRNFLARTHGRAAKYIYLECENRAVLVPDLFNYTQSPHHTHTHKQIDTCLPHINTGLLAMHTSCKNLNTQCLVFFPFFGPSCPTHTHIWDRWDRLCCLGFPFCGRGRMAI